MHLIWDSSPPILQAALLLGGELLIVVICATFRCPVPGCKETLFITNKVLCNDCKREVCLKHRYGLDHNCEAFRKADSNNRSLSSFGNLFLKSFKERASSLGAQPSSSARRPSTTSSSSSGQAGGFAGALKGLQTAASSVQASMEAGMQKLALMTTSTSASPEWSSTGQVSQSEECPQCQAQFSNLTLLIQHVERVHENASTQEMLDICPKCGKKFRDPIALVNHVERDHGGSSS